MCSQYRIDRSIAKQWKTSITNETIRIIWIFQASAYERSNTCGSTKKTGLRPQSKYVLDATYNYDFEIEWKNVN